MKQGWIFKIGSEYFDQIGEKLRFILFFYFYIYTIKRKLN